MKKYSTTIILGIIAVLLIIAICIFNFVILKDLPSGYSKLMTTVLFNDCIGVSIILDVFYMIYDFLKKNKKDN